MSSDPSLPENDLRQIHAAALDEALLARLEACADGTWTRLGPVELEFEHRLRGIAPSRMSASLMASLESAVAGVPFQTVAPKILRFPAVEVASRKSRGWWSAAAAVALFGGLAGLLIPTAKLEKTAAVQPGVPPIRSASAAALIPAGFNRGLREASDEGVIWQSSQQPHRVVKVVYQDRVTLKDASGHTYQVEQPRVEYILVPAETN